MSKNAYILDACALIALLAGEPGADKVKNIIQDAIDGKAKVKVNQINLLEVYYYAVNVYNQDKANKILVKIKKFPIEILVGLDERTFKEAGRIKSTYKIPLGDSIAAAESIVRKEALVTSDHSDFDKVEVAENIKICWFR